MSPERQIPGDAARALSPLHVEDSSSTRIAILGYFLILALAGGLGAPTGIAAIPIGYFLKDNLHLSPVDLALFVAIAGAPAYVGFLPGFVRDRFRPRIMGDRFFLLVGALIAFAAYLYLGLAPIDYLRLLFATLIAG